VKPDSDKRSSTRSFKITKLIGKVINKPKPKSKKPKVFKMAIPNDKPANHHQLPLTRFDDVLRISQAEAW
jgi:hypothetical protein